MNERNKRDDTDKPPVLSEERHSVSLLDDSALLRAVTPPPAPPPPTSPQQTAAVKTPAYGAQLHPPLIVVLTLIAVSLAFLAGFWCRGLVCRVALQPRTDSSVATNDANNNISKPQTLTGRLAWYDAAEQRVKDDSDAVVILLPEDQTPSVLLPASSARNKSQQEAFAAQLYELGGGFAATNSDGIFTIAVEPGNYTLLALSSQTRSTTEPVTASVVANLKRYFVSPDDGLIGTSRYHYVRSFTVPVEIKTPLSPLLHVF